MEQELIIPDEIDIDKPQIISVPDDFKGLDIKKDEPKIVDLFVQRWNSMVTEVENQTLLFAKMVLEVLKGQEEETILEIIKKIKSHPDIKLTLSRDRIWQGVRLLKQVPALLEAPQVLDSGKDEWIRKKDGTICFEYYFELYKQNLPDQMRAMFEVKGREENWSLRTLKDKIREWRCSELDPSKKDRNEKSELITEIIKELRGFNIDKVRAVKTFIMELNKE